MATITSFDLNGSGSGLDESRTIQEGASAILLAPSATLSASGNFNGQSLRLSGLLAEAQIGFGSGVSLSGTSVRVGGVTVGSVTGGQNGTDLVIAFNSNATASRVQTVLRNLTYNDVSDTPTASQTITLNLAGTVRTDAITVVPVNDRPLLDLNGAASGTGSSATFIENRSVAVAPSGSLTDPDTSSLVSLKATLLARPDGDGLERLSLDAAAASAAAAAGLTVTYTASAGLLSIDGNASVATYQAILRGILYENGSDQPSTAARTVRISANDGIETSLPRDASVAITRVNDAPVLDLNGAAAGSGATLAHRAGDPPAALATLATVADIDSANFGGGPLRVALTANGSTADQLRIMTDATVTISGSTVRVGGTSVGSVTGGANGADLVISLNTGATPAAIQILLQHIGFSTGAGSSTSPRQVTFTLNDGDGTANGGTAVASAVATVELTAGPGNTNVAPTLTGDLQATIANNSTYQLTTSDIFYTDPDDGPAGVTFTVSNLDNGYVRRNGTAVTSFTAEQLAAGQITYWHDGSEPVGSFRISVEDGNEDGSTPVAQNFVFTITTGQVNAPPTLTGDLRANVATGGTYVLGQADLFYTDPDDSATGVTFTVSGITGGTLLVNGAAATSFTPSQLSGGLVSFRHDGSSTAPAFSVSVEDGNEDGSTPVAQNFLFSVTTPPVNAPPTLTGDLRANVATGGTYVLGQADLFYTDPDDSATGVAFSVSGVTGGTLLVNGVAATSFTPSQLSGGLVSFRHDGSSTAPAFSVSVEDGNEDGSAPVAQSFLFTVITAPVNAPPTLTGDLRASVASGGTYVLAQADLFYTDPDDSTTGVAFTVSGVTGGTLLVNGVAAASFTPSQLSGGLVSFRHDGSSAAPSFSVSVEDGNEDGSTPVAQNFLVTVTTGNVAPVLTGDLQATIANNSTYQLTTSDIFYTDPDDGPAGVTFTVSNLDNGYVRRNGTAVTSFTAEQLAAGQITYWHDGSEPVGSFRISVEDGNEDGSTPVAQNFVFTITTGQVNAPPTLTGDLRATVTAGGTYVLGQADLFYTDPDDSATGVVFSVSGVTGGTLLVNGAAATSFTPSQLSGGLVSFRHNGSSATPSFSVSVEDGNEDGSAPVAQNFLFTVTTGQGNVAPILTGDLQATIANNSTYQFTTSDIFYTDPDDNPAGITFTVSNLDNGYVRRNGTAVTSFTAEQLAAGQITYWHDGSEPVGSFRISVEDGNEDGSTPVAQNFVFTITTGQVNTPPTLTGDLRATVISGGTYVLNQADVFYTDPDDSTTGVAFTVSGVTGGTLLVNGVAAASFTPSQLSGGLVSFRHDGTSTAPSFSVSVEDGNEDGSAPVARSFILDVGGGGGSTLDLSSATRGVRVDLGAAQWVLATKVMALGDSITNGDAPTGQDEHGYRGFFYQNVVGSGLLVDMVGPNSNGQVPDPQHAGYPGETGDDIQALLPNLLATYTPSAILLMVGTNDIFYKNNPQVPVRAEITAMLDHVAQASPTTHVYVSTLIPLAGYDTEVANVNAAIRSLVADAIGRGQNVSLVEMPSVTLSDLFDGIHPSDTGYREMAGYWASAVLGNPPATGAGTTIDAAVTTVIGSLNNDLLIGDGRANELSGGAGADWIRGEGGNDLLSGGAGRDVFVFGAGFGQDTVQDFVRGEDLLDFRALALNVGDFATWRQDHISALGSSAIVTIQPGLTVTLTGVTATALQANDFLFA
ncbi:cadherin-like domain-containing protein [Bosea sp. BK604]|uniref:cadherin-like domain-containing protein n=1 Tax=Bosea sp. BK604 TaxID=2512180 RepID=UPI001043BD94|nr:cadherin-like domain-containing protein [Bosea sp. BK604]TCR66425.1 lysophospholipase L1-like esterase [Bosea sp. BK604]